MSFSDFDSEGREFESLRARHSTILYDIVPDRRANAASSRRQPLTEPLAIQTNGTAN